MYRFDKENHIHLLNDKPLMGTSTVLQVLAKPLTWWASGLAVKELSGIEDCKIFTKIKNKKATKEEMCNLIDTVQLWLDTHKNIDTQQYITLLDKAYRAHSVRLEDTAQAGTDLHSELERFVKDSMNGVIGIIEYDEKIKPFIIWSQQYVKRFLWSEGYCYSETEWCGGISDCGAELTYGKIVIIDFKSAKSAYPTHFFQCAGYDIEISENGILDENGKLVYALEKPIDSYAIVPFGSKDVVPIFNDDIQGNRGAFLATLTLYKELQKYQD